MIYDEDLINQGNSQPTRSKEDSSRVISLKCFNPAFCFSEIMSKQPRSLILASGTLSPLDLLEQELGVKFHIKLKNDHVIKDDQVSIFNLRSYPKIENTNSDDEEKRVFDFTMKNRGDHQMILALGETINQLSMSVGKGVGTLVFFSSYTVMNNC